MFRLSEERLDPEALKRSLADSACGACVTFEGWVRENNEGRRVLRLDYEAYAAVAEKEGARIVGEACARFGLRHAACVHRVGRLGLGDLAAWVGAVSPHRSEAFEACRYIIDAIKHTVPIWKKEFYEGGDSGWVNCERCAHPHGHAHAAVSPEAYYARQVCLPEVGAAGQRRLANARVLVVGAGGLGCGVLPALGAAGIGVLGICDGDQVDTSNLHRQTLYTPADCGKPKAGLAAARLQALNPLITCQAHEEVLIKANAAAILADYDLVVDCTDNFETKFLLNTLAVKLGKALIQAGIYQYEGQLFAYAPASGKACMQCLWPEPPAPDCVGSCADVGVLGAVPAVFGALQAMETLKQLLGLPDRLIGEVLYFDLLTYRSRRVSIPRKPKCPACGNPSEREATADEEIIEIGPGNLDGLTFVDVRERGEALLEPLDGITHLAWPVSLWRENQRPFPPGPRYLLFCTHGRRSKQLARMLRREGYQAYSLAGGVRSLLARR